MRRLTRKHLTLVSIVGLAMLTGIAVSTVLYASQAGSSHNGLGVDTETLAEQGIHLSSPPQGYSPKVNSAQAVEIANASSTYGQVSYRETVLQHLTTTSLGGFEGEVWLLSVDTQDPELKPSGSGGTMTYILRFIDAETGQRLMTLSEEAPPVGGWDPDIGPLLQSTGSQIAPGKTIVPSEVLGLQSVKSIEVAESGGAPRSLSQSDIDVVVDMAYQPMTLQEVTAPIADRTVAITITLDDGHAWQFSYAPSSGALVYEPANVQVTLPESIRKLVTLVLQSPP